MKIKILVVICMGWGFIQSQTSYDFKFGVVQYYGGGDWYEGKVGVIELMEFANKHHLFKASPTYHVVTLTGTELYDYNLLYITGHGNWELSQVEIFHLKNYLKWGGFLFINDDYGIHKSVIREIKKIFPKQKWVRLPSDHMIYHIYYKFFSGAPKIHKHDGGPPEIMAIYYNGKVSILYTKNTDIGDGWAPYQVHKDKEIIREKALKFGFNIILYSMIR